MQRLRHEEEQERYRFERETFAVEEELAEARVESREVALAEVKKNLPLGIAQGGLAAWVMTELGRLNNPSLQIDGQNAWQLYALLGGIAGLAAATGRKNTAWTATGMAAGVLISPPLLDLLVRVTGRFSFYENGQPALVIVAALMLGAFVWLKKVNTLRAALMGAAGFCVIDIVYNVARGGFGPGLADAAWISAEHGFLVGGALALAQSASQTLLDWRTKMVDRAADWTMAFLKQTKGE
jgi:hypothetical protein